MRIEMHIIYFSFFLILYAMVSHCKKKMVVMLLFSREKDITNTSFVGGEW